MKTNIVSIVGVAFFTLIAVFAAIWMWVEVILS